MARTAHIVLTRPYFPVENVIIDEYGPKIGAIGVAVYAVLDRYADRCTGECWPKIKTICAKLRLGESTVKRCLRTLKDLGLIRIDPRWSEEGDRTSNLYKLLDPSPAAVAARAQQSVAPQPTPSVSPGGGSVETPPSPQLPPEGGSPASPQEQDPHKQNPLNTLAPARTEQEPTPSRRSTCTHPEHEISHFAGMTLCYHCYTLLNEEHTPHEETATTTDVLAA